VGMHVPRHVFETNCMLPLQKPNILHVIRISSKISGQIKNIYHMLVSTKWTDQEYIQLH
jgi:hypothetical protein